MKRKTISDQLYEQVGLKKIPRPDNVLRWDGNRLYMVDPIYRDNKKIDDQERDVTDQFLKFIAVLLGKNVPD